MSTAGWKLLVQWKDGSEQWVPLRLLKENNPVEVTEFAVTKKIDDEVAFASWIPYKLRKRDMIIIGVNARVKKATHTYELEVPRSMEYAMQIDKANKNMFWNDAIDKEMCNVWVVFELLDKGNKPSPGWTKSSGHLIFDIKMDFTRKAR